MADLRGVQILSIHAVFGKIWQNRMLAPPPTPPLPPLQDWRPHLGEILDPPLPFFAAKLAKEINCTTYT